MYAHQNTNFSGAYVKNDVYQMVDLANSLRKGDQQKEEPSTNAQYL